MILPKLKLKRKKREHLITPEELRNVVREEITSYGANTKKLDEEEKRKKMIKERIDNLPKRTRLKLLRYLKNKKGGEPHGKK